MLVPSVIITSLHVPVACNWYISRVVSGSKSFPFWCSRSLRIGRQKGTLIMVEGIWHAPR